MTSVVRLLRRIWAFVFPRSGWKSRVLAFRGGQTVWRFSEHAGKALPAVGPWPPEWTPFRVVDKDGASEVEFIDVVSDLSGMKAEGEAAVACARCGVHMHVVETNMQTNLDIPACPWCRERVAAA
jgi:hypothetical protein